MYLWFIMVVPVIVVILSESRGGIIGFAFSFLGVMIFNLVKGHRIQLIQMLAFFLLIFIIFFIYQEALFKWWDTFVQSFGQDLNEFSSGRLDIYRQGYEVFKAHPIFGGGWLSLQQLNPDTRLFMYHSTIVQTFAAMGLFGFIALCVHYIQVASFFFRSITLEKSLFMIGYLASQIHGIIDNVQYVVAYSVILIIIFSIWENSNTQTEFDIIQGRYQLVDKPSLIK